MSLFGLKPWTIKDDAIQIQVKPVQPLIQKSIKREDLKKECKQTQVSLSNFFPKRIELSVKSEKPEYKQQEVVKVTKLKGEDINVNPKKKIKISPLHERNKEENLNSVIDWEDCKTHLCTKGIKAEELWEYKLIPHSMNEIWGHEDQKEILNAWLKKGKPFKPILLCGASGSGKTILIRTLFKVHGYQVWDESMLSGEDNLSDAISILLERKPLIGNLNRGILIECAEGLFSSEIRGLLTVLKKQLSIPIIITCDDQYDIHIKGLKSLCNVIVIKPMAKHQALDFLCKASTKLCQPMTRDSADVLYENSQGNLRFALNEYEFLRKTIKRKKFEHSSSSLAECDPSWNLFKEVGRICTGILDPKSEEIASSDCEIALMMLQHNLPASASSQSMKAFAFAMDAHSSADILNKYHEPSLAISLAIKSTAIACKNSRGFLRMNFPLYLGIMSKAKHKAKLCKTAASVENTSNLICAFESMERLQTLHQKVRQLDIGGIKGCQAIKARGLWHEIKEANEILRNGIQFKT